MLFGYLVFLRTRGVSVSFWLLGDQIRDWSVALGSWSDLPLAGTPSVAGGTTLGPVFYWTLWGIRHAVGPWTDNLPHAGSIGLSIIQSFADGVLLAALWKRLGSFVLVPLPPSTDPHFLYQVLGGRLSPAAPLEAFIDASGRASFRIVNAEGGE